MALDDIFQNFLEEEPRAAFFGTLRSSPDFRDTSARRRQAENIYQDAMSEFYGQLGENIIQGEPIQDFTFTDFLQQFPFTERFAQLGRESSQLNRYRPRTRFLYY
jgi:hypothetical protein|tara:strand:+ start:132 stop:446 length:315 start_codon:yes stop_codon:yes gene_type:complete